MKNKRNVIIVVIVLIILILLSAYVGYSIAENKYDYMCQYNAERNINFAVNEISKLKESYDEDTMKTLISCVYGAYQYSDIEGLSPALFDLWNALIFDGENIVGKEDLLMEAIQDGDTNAISDIARSMRTIVQ